MRLYSTLLEYFLVRCPLAIALNINHTLRESKQFRNSSEHKEQTKKTTLCNKLKRHQVSHSKMTNVHHFVKIFEIRCPFLRRPNHQLHGAVVFFSVGMLGKHVLGAIKVATKCNTAGNLSCYGKLVQSSIYLYIFYTSNELSVNLMQMSPCCKVVGILHDSSCTQIFVIM